MKARFFLIEKLPLSKLGGIASPWSLLKNLGFKTNLKPIARGTASD